MLQPRVVTRDKGVPPAPSFDHAGPAPRPAGRVRRPRITAAPEGDGNGKTLKPPATERLTIAPPNIKTARFAIVGTAPYVQHAFSQKARGIMHATQEAGSTSRGKKVRQPRDFQADYQAAMHKTAEGWYGIPATAFRNAMVSACRMAQFKMTHAKLSVFILADGMDQDGHTPLVRITKGEPQYLETAARNDNGGCDLRARPLWSPGWEATVAVQFDADQFTVKDVANLLMRAGIQVGVGEGRPDSPNSCGMGWGTFRLRED